MHAYLCILYVSITNLLVLQSNESGEPSQQYTEKCIKKCREAIRLLRDIGERLLNGHITVKELELINLHLSQTVKLFSPEVVAKIITVSSFNVAEVVAKRMFELQKFNSYHCAVKTVLEHCRNILKRGTYPYM